MCSIPSALCQSLTQKGLGLGAFKCTCKTSEIYTQMATKVIKKTYQIVINKLTFLSPSPSSIFSN